MGHSIMTSLHHETPNFDTLTDAEIEQFMREGRRLRAQQAGVLFAALKEWIGDLLGDRRDHGRPTFGATPPRAAH